MSSLTYATVTREVIRPMFKPTVLWFGALGLAFCALAIGGYSWYTQLAQGLGTAGYHPPVMWGVYITTFVFWIGIGHAGAQAVMWWSSLAGIFSPLRRSSLLA